MRDILYVVTINYTTQFEYGQAADTLRFALDDGQASLLSYNLVSPLLAR